MTPTDSMQLSYIAGQIKALAIHHHKLSELSDQMMDIITTYADPAFIETEDFSNE